MDVAGTPVKLKIEPGFFSETGDRDAIGRWKTGNLVRFKNGLPEKMGGWEEATITGATMRGIDRREHEWNSLDGQPWIAQGTSKKLFLINRGQRYDITPVRRSVELQDPITVSLVPDPTEAPDYEDAVLWLEFDGANASTTFTDASANAATVTAVGSAQITTTNPKYGTGALLLDGSGDYASIPIVADGPLDLPRHGDFTIEFWCYSATLSSGNNILAMLGDRLSNTGLMIAITAASVQVGVVEIGWSSFASTAVLTDNTWTHLAVVREGSNARLYINGTLNGNAAANTWTPDTPHLAPSIRIGEGFPGEPFYTGFPGRIDEFKIFDYAKYTANFTPEGPPIVTEVTILDLLHGAEQGDFVRFSGASVVAGLDINGEHEITEVLNGNQYLIDVGDAVVEANGGGTVVTEYDINTGPDSAEQAHGWGTCTYGTGTFGTRRGDCSAIILGPRLWSLDSFGEDLLASPRGGSLYWWDRSLGPTSRAVVVETAPITIERMLVSPSGDQVIALGAFDSVAGSPDKMLVRASAIGTFAEWELPVDPEEENTVFDKRLTNGSRILTGFKTNGGVVIETDKASYVMLPDSNEIYLIPQVATENTACGPNAGTDVNGTAYWMARDKIMSFDGVQQEIPCDVWGYVFDNEAATEGKTPGFNRDQADKVYCYYNARGDEVTWFYPSAASDENDRYLCFNRTDRVWYYGALARTAMSTGGIAYSLPYGSAPTGELFLHEGVPDADGELMNEYVESWDMQIGEGSDATHLSLFVPDFKRWTGTVRMTLIAKDRPNQAAPSYTSEYDMEDTTTEQGVHFSARMIALRIGSIELGASWRMAPGTFYGQPDASG